MAEVSLGAVSIMTWNVRYFGHGARGLRASPRWMRRMAWVLAGQPEIPDVIALQEVEDGSLRAGPEPQLARFLELFHEALSHHRRPEHYAGLYFPAHRYELRSTSFYTTGLALLVSSELSIEAHNAGQPDDITHVRLSSLGKLKQRRIVGHARLRTRAGTTLNVYNTHLSLPAFFEVGPILPRHMGSGSNQLAEAKNLLEVLDRTDPGPAVLVGDFNSAPGSPVYDSLLRGGLVDVHHATSGLELEALREHSSAGFLHYRMHLDHVFTRGKAVRPLSLDAHSIDAGPFRGLSDHAPKIGVFELG
jgi:endonuclease/exonuclease/phosphatase family metal-dependent hydrolase